MSSSKRAATRLLHHIHTSVDALKLHGKDGEQLTLPKPVITNRDKLGSAKDATPRVIQKRNIKTYPVAEKPAHSIDILNENGEHKATLYTTTTDKLPLLARYGMLNADTLRQNPILQVVADLGEYIAIVNTRLFKRSIKSKRAKVKWAIAKHAQEAHLGLLDLWESINDYNEALTPEKNLIHVLEKLDAVHQKFSQQKLEINAIDDEGNEHLKAFKTAFIAGITKNIAQVEKLVTRLRHNYCTNMKPGYVPTSHLRFRADIQADDIKALLSPVGLKGTSGAIFHFIQDQMEIINSSTNTAENSISDVFGRAELFKCIKKAEKHTREMATMPDYHNSSPSELSLNFNKGKPNDRVITIDLGEHGAKKIESTGDLIYQFTMLDHIETATEFKPIQVPYADTEGRFGLNWTDISKSSVIRTSFKFLAGIFTFLGDIGAMFVNPKKGYPSERFDRFLLEKFPDEREAAYKKNHSLAEKVIGAESVTQFKQSSPLRSFKGFAWTQLKKLTVDPVLEVARSVKNWLNGAKRIGYDWSIGSKPTSATEIANLLRNKTAQAASEAERIDAELNTYINEFNQEHKNQPVCLHADLKADPVAKTFKELEIEFDDRAKEFRKNGYTKRLARTPRNLQSDVLHDAVSSLVHGARFAVDFFAELYEEHEFAATLGFTVLGGLFGGLPMLVPAVAASPMFKPLLGGLSKPIAAALEGKTAGFTAALSTDLIVGKLTLLSIDSLKKGPNSYLAKAMRGTCNNLALTAIGATTAILVGYYLTFKADIPWLSEHLAEENAGSFQAPEDGFVGLKFAALIAEGLFDLEGNHEHMQARLITLRKRLKDELIIAYVERHKHLKKTVSNLDQNDYAEIDRATDHYMNWINAVRSPTGQLTESTAVMRLVYEFHKQKKAIAGIINIEADKLEESDADLQPVPIEPLFDVAEHAEAEHKYNVVDTLTQLANHHISDEVSLHRLKGLVADLEEHTAANQAKRDQIKQAEIKRIAELRAYNDSLADKRAQRVAKRKQQRQADFQAKRKRLKEMLAPWHAAEAEIQKEFMREQINSQDFDAYTEKEKYKVMHYVRETYGDTHPEYVAAVRAKIYKVNRTSPVATTIQIGMSYLPEIFRAISSVFQCLTRDAAKRKRAVARLTEFGHKIRGDLGILSHDMHMALRAVFYLPTIVVKSVLITAFGLAALLPAAIESWIRLGIRKNPQASVAPSITFSVYKFIVSIPMMLGKRPAKIFNRAFEALSGWLRRVATHRDIHLANTDIKKKQIAKNKALPEAKRMPVSSMAELMLEMKQTPEKLTPQKPVAKAPKSIVVEEPAEVAFGWKDAEENVVDTIPIIQHPFDHDKTVLVLKNVRKGIDLHTISETEKEVFSTQKANEKLKSTNIFEDTREEKGPWDATLRKPKKIQTSAPLPTVSPTAAPLQAASVPDVSVAVGESDVAKHKPIDAKEAPQSPSLTPTEHKETDVKSQASPVQDDPVTLAIAINGDATVNLTISAAIPVATAPATIAPEIEAVIQRETLQKFVEKFTYSDKTIRHHSRGDFVHVAKLNSAEKIRLSAKSEPANVDNFLKKLEEEIMQVHKARWQANTRKDGEFELQIEKALTACADHLRNSYEMDTDKRADYLEKINRLIQLNRHDEVFAVLFALKDLRDAPLPLNRADAKHLRQIQQAIINVETRLNGAKVTPSDYSLEEIWSAIKADDGMKGASELYLRAHRKRQNDFVSFFSRDKNRCTAQSVYDSRQVENAYEYLRNGLNQLAEQFAAVPAMHKQVMGCYQAAQANKQHVHVDHSVASPRKSIGFVGR